MAAKAGAHDGEFFRLDFGPVAQILQSRGVHRMSIGAGKQWALACPRTIHDETAPALSHEGFPERVAFFFPVVDATPVHDQRRRQLLRQAEMADNRFLGRLAKRYRYSLDGNFEILRSCEKHFASFFIRVVFPRRAWERVARNTIVPIGK